MILQSHLIFIPARPARADVFPYHRCADYDSNSLPYTLSPPVETTPGLYCMTLTYNGDVSSPSECYNILSSQGGTSLIMGVSE